MPCRSRWARSPLRRSPGNPSDKSPVGRVRALSVQDSESRSIKTTARWRGRATKRRRVRCTPGSTSRLQAVRSLRGHPRDGTPSLGTLCAWRAGRTSGSTRGSRSTPSGCGPSTREGSLRRPTSTTSRRPSLPTSPGAATRDRRTRDSPTCSTVRCTTGERRRLRHALRLRVGDTAFFRILKTWTRTKAGQAVTTPMFIALAERVFRTRTWTPSSTPRTTPGGYPADAVAAARTRGSIPPHEPIPRPAARPLHRDPEPDTGRGELLRP